MADNPPRTLHALLIAINDYPVHSHKLRGCVPDLLAFKDYLERRFRESKAVRLRFYQKEVDGQPRFLTDHLATRANIIEAFDFFRQAQPGDTCLLYFSGHGSRAFSPPEFRHLDTDEMCESIVCYDSRIEGGRDLYDKELSYLIHQATEGRDVHFTAVFDCCHAGSNTRALGDVTPRMANQSNTVITIDDLEGQQVYLRETIDNQLQVTPPRGRHLQIGAAKNNETAKEMTIGGEKRGVFTYHLIELLERSGGQLTYPELVHLLGVRVANKVKDQTPVYTAIAKADPEQLFLGGALPRRAPHFLVSHGPEGWQLNAGRIQGIPETGGSVRLEDGATARILQVSPNHSLLMDLDAKDKSETFRAVAHEMPIAKVRIAIAKDSEAAGVKPLREVFASFENAPFLLVDENEEHQYLILADKGSYRLVTPDSPRPLFRRVTGYNAEKARVFLLDVETVARWQALLDLNNPNSTITEEDFEIRLFRTAAAGKLENTDPVEPIDWRATNDFHYDFTGDKWQPHGFRMKVKNTGHQPLFVSALYMQFDYGVKNDFLRWREIGPDEEVELQEEFRKKVYKTIPLSLGDKYQKAGLTEIRDYLKLFISTDPKLDTDGYNQKGLEMDVPKAVTRDSGRAALDDQPPIPDWTTRELAFNIIRPLEETELAGQQPAQLLNASVSAPAGFRAKVSLAAAAEGQRSLNANLPAPDQLWGAQKKTTPFLFSEGNSHAPGLSMLELRDIEGAEHLKADTPLELQLTTELEDDEYVVPLGYDETTGCFYPLGFSGEGGVVHIETLPETSPSGTRSLTGSVKIFFQKVVLSKLGFEYRYPQLAVAEFAESGEDFEYLTDTETVKEKVAGAQKILLYIHGIIGNTSLMTRSARRITADEGHYLLDRFDLVLTFDYENLQTKIQETAVDLKTKLAEAGLAENHGKELTVVAHSMGGLACRWFIEREGGDAVIQHLVQVGTPNRGTPWADVYELASILLYRVSKGAAFLKPYTLPLILLGKQTKILFTTLQQMDPDDSRFLDKLNDSRSPKTRYTVIAGNTQLIPLSQAVQDQEKKVLRKVLLRFKERGHFEALDALLFGEPNDIAASVHSITGLPPREQPVRTITVGCDHLSYFGHPEGLRGLREALLDQE